jgi:uroporphyrinogen-III synthase
MSALPPLRVLNTRPQDRAEPLSHALQTAGYAVIDLPLLDFAPCQAVQVQALRIHLHQQACVIIVVSPMAASRGLCQLIEDGLDPCQLAVQWVAVGEATAHILRQAGLIASIPTQQNSEGLLALPVVAQIQTGQQVVVWRGEGGRALIQQTLLAQGVLLDSLVLYRRVRPTGLDCGWQQIRSAGSIDVVLISSGEAWACWLDLAGVDAFAPWLLVLGERLYEQLAKETTRLSRLVSLAPDVILKTLDDLHLQIRDSS